MLKHILHRSPTPAFLPTKGLFVVKIASGWTGSRGTDLEGGDWNLQPHPWPVGTGGPGG
jgi:hypothetical protein